MDVFETRTWGEEFGPGARLSGGKGRAPVALTRRPGCSCVCLGCMVDCPSLQVLTPRRHARLAYFPTCAFAISSGPSEPPRLSAEAALLSASALWSDSDTKKGN